MRTNVERHFDQTDVLAARRYAIEMHGAQMYGPHPYIHHLDAVAATLEPYGAAAQMLGYLHDVVEDTSSTEEDIRVRFGSFHADGVGLLTDEPGATRKERKQRTYPKLATVHGPLVLALVAKVADRLSNVRQCVNDANSTMWDVYRGEHDVFRDAAYREGVCDELWAELDGLLAARPSSRGS